MRVWVLESLYSGSPKGFWMHLLYAYSKTTGALELVAGKFCVNILFQGFILISNQGVLFYLKEVISIAGDCTNKIY